ncbi:hypothetical protein CONPUDRAFT_66560 [Coniophora puteana RWD-64-598 SS2]|uniref:Uncharacterized protein n=1 Tax=Coniophora puteana (strain RWD-64-598) TaxID=741705 RepID=A0A5M3M7H9_CONPW|nr:uncharacterized protein CONPUDRAFT_66560 [Coniophora puteana RWD-64-598 SS2]EIW75003.1 hypothetical protein CONPUDRAFT_66560 [Coniophora puteana RWD-64-598 SS2]
MDSSLDLNGLAKSLPASNFEKAEKDMLNNFKAAALSITTLYKSSRHASKSAYNAGYAAACNDFLLMLQQGVSSGAIPSDPPHPSSYSSMSGSNQAMDPMMEHGGGMGVGRIMDWVEARLEAIKARQEEELEDEEREKERERIKSLAATAGASSSSSAMRMRKDNGAGSSSKREEGPKSDQRQGSSSMVSLIHVALCHRS